MLVCFLKSSNLCWKSSISLATNSEHFSCCTVSVLTLGLVGFAGRMEMPGRPDSGLRAVCWTPLDSILYKYGLGQWHDLLPSGSYHIAWDQKLLLMAQAKVNDI